MNKKNITSFFTARNIAFLAILVALTIVLQLFASAIPMFGVTMNFSLIPIVLAAIFFGPIGGGWMGFISGLLTFIVTALMGKEPSTLYLFQASPVILTIICIGKTTVAGLVSGLLYDLLHKKNQVVASYVSSIIVPILNTGIYLLGMVLMRGDVAAFLGTDSSAAGFIFITVFTIIWLNFVLEMVVNVVLSPAIAYVVKIVEKRINK